MATIRIFQFQSSRCSGEGGQRCRYPTCGMAMVQRTEPWNVGTEVDKGHPHEFEISALDISSSPEDGLVLSDFDQLPALIGARKACAGLGLVEVIEPDPWFWERLTSLLGVRTISVSGFFEEKIRQYLNFTSESVKRLTSHLRTGLLSSFGGEGSWMTAFVCLARLLDAVRGCGGVVDGDNSPSTGILASVGRGWGNLRRMLSSLVFVNAHCMGDGDLIHHKNSSRMSWSALYCHFKGNRRVAALEAMSRLQYCSWLILHRCTCGGCHVPLQLSQCFSAALVAPYRWCLPCSSLSINWRCGPLFIGIMTLLPMISQYPFPGVASSEWALEVAVVATANYGSLDVSWSVLRPDV
ncbi:hypothetical protein Tco_0002686 [Tanacetum coccineum]